MCNEVIGGLDNQLLPSGTFFIKVIRWKHMASTVDVYL